MVLQGLLRACSQRSGFLVHTIERVRESGRQIPIEEFCFVVESEYANYVALQEHIMGSMKSLQPNIDMPFDVRGFVYGVRAHTQSMQVKGLLLSPEICRCEATYTHWTSKGR